MRVLASIAVGVVLAGVMSLVALRAGGFSISRATPAAVSAISPRVPVSVEPQPVFTREVTERPVRLPLKVRQALLTLPSVGVRMDFPSVPVPRHQAPAQATPTIQIIPGSPSAFGGLIEPSRTPAEEELWRLRESIQIRIDVATGLCSREVGNERFAKLNGRKIAHTGTIEMRSGPPKARPTTQPGSGDWVSSLDRR